MAHKILYIEDQQADSIKSDLESFGFVVETNNADSFDGVINQLTAQYDAYIIDYRLTAEKGLVDAPTYAQTLRSKNKKINHKEAPIILISNEKNFVDIYEDYTSQDLFDFSISKELFRKEMKKFSERITSYIFSYAMITDENCLLSVLLGIDDSQISKKIDYRFIEKFKHEKNIKNNAFGCCSLICNSLVRAIGPLVGVDILSSRLGISKDSKDWSEFIKLFDDYKYKGIFSDIYERWWFDDVLTWWGDVSKGKSLRRTPSELRVSLISENTKLNLSTISPVRFYNSSNYWSICSKTKEAIDPSEAYVINNFESQPWQENTYLSHIALLEYPELQEKLTAIDRKDLLDFLKTLK